MSANVVLFDIPSKLNGEDRLSCLSLNPWKARMILNYKRIPYETQWVEWYEIEATLKPTGVPPNEPGTAPAPYTSPAVRLPNGDVVMNTPNIARALEKLYPTPSLHLEDEQVWTAAQNAVSAALLSVWWDLVLRFPPRVLAPRSAAYVRKTLEERFGATLEALAATRGGEAAWAAAEAPGGAFELLKEVLTKWKRDDGPFVLGSRASYADFVVVGFFECWRRICGAVDAGEYERLMGFSETFGELHSACEEWLERDD